MYLFCYTCIVSLVYTILASLKGWTKAKAGEICDLVWKNGRYTTDEIASAPATQRFNHFINSGLITRKAGMSYYLKKMRQEFGSIYDYFPTSIILDKQRVQSITESLSEETKKRVCIYFNIFLPYFYINYSFKV